MKAALITEFGGAFATAEVQIADPVGREALVDVRASGLCHTDHTLTRHDSGFFPMPAVCGHEIAGVVAAVGPDVRDVAVGDHVVGCLVQYCGGCRHCVAGEVGLCLHPEVTLREPDAAPRLHRDGEPVTQLFGLGGFAERALVNEQQLTVIPKAVSFPQAAVLGCAVVTGIGAVLHAAEVKTGDSVVILGAGGGVGLNGISGAKLAGATTIVAVDLDSTKLEKAQRFGATHTVNARDGDPVAGVRDIVPVGVDAVFDFIGIPAVTRQGLAMTARGGGLYLTGIMDPTGSVDLGILETVGFQRRVQGVYMGSCSPQRDIRAYAELYLQGRLPLDELVSREIPLDDVEKGYALAGEPGVSRVVVTSF